MWVYTPTKSYVARENATSKRESHAEVMLAYNVFPQGTAVFKSHA
jgi:hypothetical protein